MRKYLFITKLCSVLTAQALGDPSVTIEEVTPSISPSGTLFPTEVLFSFFFRMRYILIFAIVSN